MEIVDELMTPGCPNCAIKHLSAAVAYLVEDGRIAASARAVPEPFRRPSFELLARAYINLTEALEGYSSHRTYAAGLMVMAEEAELLTGNAQFAVEIRDVRCRIMAETETREDLSRLATWARACMAEGHVVEAARELPDAMADLNMNFMMNGLRWGQETVDEIVETIGRIREEYFGKFEKRGGEQDGVCDEEDGREGGDEGGLQGRQDVQGQEGLQMKGGLK